MPASLIQTNRSIEALSWKSVVRYPGIIGSGAFVCYVSWNVWWIAHCMVPPSMLIGLLGIPAPTTGMTRSVIAFSQGNWSAGFLWNPMTVPFLLMLAWTIAELMRNRFNHGPLMLSRQCAWSWFGVLLAGWIAKLVIGPDWW
jgi:hypothetical protein